MCAVFRLDSINIPEWLKDMTVVARMDLQYHSSFSVSLAATGHSAMIDSNAVDKPTQVSMHDLQP